MTSKNTFLLQSPVQRVRASTYSPPRRVRTSIEHRPTEYGESNYKVSDDGNDEEDSQQEYIIHDQQNLAEEMNNE